MRVILASSSPRRKELLKLIIRDFETIASNADEKIQKNLEPEEQVVKLSNLKAKTVFDKTKEDRIVIGSDTIVVKDKKIYGKPKNKEDAKQMIKELLQGDRTHEILTGLSVLSEINKKKLEYNVYDRVKVYLKDMTDNEIEEWIDMGKAIDRAGAYGIQDEFCAFVEKIEGNYTSAVGLPVHKLYDIVKEIIGL